VRRNLLRRILPQLSPGIPQQVHPAGGARLFPGDYLFVQANFAAAAGKVYLLRDAGGKLWEYPADQGGGG
jgi:hypothetical protein